MVTIRRAVTDADWHEAAALLHDHVDWMRARTAFDPLAEQPALGAELDAVAARYGDDDAAMFLADWRGVVVGTVAVRCHHDGAAELKRMFVRPVARGRGVADRLLDAAVAFAERSGCHHIWLETVRGSMDAAIAVYRRNGFTETAARPATLSMPGVVVMERALAAARCSA